MPARVAQTEGGRGKTSWGPSNSSFLPSPWVRLCSRVWLSNLLKPNTRVQGNETFSRAPQHSDQHSTGQSVSPSHRVCHECSLENGLPGSGPKSGPGLSRWYPRCVLGAGPGCFTRRPWLLERLARAFRLLERPVSRRGGDLSSGDPGGGSVPASVTRAWMGLNRWLPALSCLNSPRLSRSLCVAHGEGCLSYEWRSGGRCACGVPWSTSRRLLCAGSISRSLNSGSRLRGVVAGEDCMPSSPRELAPVPGPACGFASQPRNPSRLSCSEVFLPRGA